MIIYGTYIMVCILASIQASKKGLGMAEGLNKLCLKVSCFFLFLMIGLRHYSIGSDTQSYCNDFLNYKNYRWSEIIAKGTNYGFYVFNKVMSCIAPNSYTIYLAVVALITVVAIYFFLKCNSKDILMSQVMLLSLGFVFFFMTGIKQTLAISVLLFAYEQLKEKHLIRFIFLVGLATLFHNTAIVFLLAWPVSCLKFKKLYILIAPLSIFLVYIFRLQIFGYAKGLLGDVYSAYGTIYESENNLTGLFIQICIFAVSLFLLWNNKKDDETKLLLSLYVIGMAFQAMTGVMAEFFRISLYFSVFGVILLPKALVEGRPDCRLLIYIGSLLVFVLYFFIANFDNVSFSRYLMFWQ